MFPADTREDTGDCRIESLKEFKFSDLKKATSNFSEDLLLGRGNYGRVFLGWVNQNTFTPTRQGDRIPIAVSRTDQECAQGHRDSKVVVIHAKQKSI
ncbi:Protein kinase, ATP binding site-containing protein [Artemisia annua]|uniref:Protein kinase, ATP binding site-containing protein n=1 Tax=Artemisia annua TaxID=35608 RepID=A0A2U1NAJ2_ARTAN|nr:Protein kinase, ATP binding site-containing protein [Artemisia annua]